MITRSKVIEKLNSYANTYAIFLSKAHHCYSKKI